ncbi:hypothetical protein BDN72DRAFT_293540 [Pluteus cervinus]|uniref:Uncharacterized protein n=1 Tax=Pluteus cervinus TaxID=181527 RepID=A0ACD3B323_9AGAR|nr:hypothetical protein BDN72DRAFT_293540 [Pluteus cervinus]
MIGNSRFEYVFIIASIAALRLIAPASIVYLILCGWYRQQVSVWLTVYAVVEAGFFVFVYLPRKHRLQVPPASLPPPLTQEQRRYLFARCLEHLNEQTLSDWFIPRSAPSTLKRHDILEWLLWAIFHSRVEDVQADWEDEINEYMGRVEDILGRTFEPGRSDVVSSLRLTFDPVQVVHRPFIWYSIVGLVDAFSTTRLLYLDFQHYTPARWFQTFPPRPLLSLLSRRAAVPPESQMAYWYRPHRSATKLPILFLHGIGIGLYPYIPIFQDILTEDPDVGIILVELLPISFHMTNGPVPSRTVVLDSLDAVLESLGIERVVFMSHSFGTFLAAYIIHSTCPQQTNLGSYHHSRHSHPVLHRISHTILIDPIPILLHIPAVAFNFLYRQPKQAAEWQLWYFASRDPDVARTLSRAFFWEQGALWGEDLVNFMDPLLEPPQEGAGIEGDDTNQPPSCCRDLKRNMTVVLSEKDQIVPVEAVRRYLTGEEEPSLQWIGQGPNWPWKKGLPSSNTGSSSSREANGATIPNSEPLLVSVHNVQETSTQVPETNGQPKLEVLFYPGLDHATVFDTKARRRLVVEAAHRYSNS